MMCLSVYLGMAARLRRLMGMHLTRVCVGSHARETSHKERNPCFSCSCIDYDQTMHSRTSKAYRAFDEQPRAIGVGVEL